MGSLQLSGKRRSARRCGDCQLCCKLLPVVELGKPASCRCEHQRAGKGCAIYADKPMSCALWNCRWLVDDECASLPRPDRSHYVVDMIPDFVTLKPHDGSEATNIPVLQVWIDPAFPRAHEAASFRAWLDRQGVCALIRSNSRDAFLLAPPSVTGKGWEEEHSNTSGPTHTLAQKAAALGGVLQIEVEAAGDDGVGRATLEIGGRAMPVAYQGRRP